MSRRITTPPPMPDGMMFTENGMPNPKAAPSNVYKSAPRNRGSRKPQISGSTKAKLLLILGLIFIGIIAFAFITGTQGVDEFGFSTSPQVQQMHEIQTITDWFVDVNGDGKVDYIKYGEVIFNDGP